MIRTGRAAAFLVFLVGECGIGERHRFQGWNGGQAPVFERSTALGGTGDRCLIRKGVRSVFW